MYSWEERQKIAEAYQKVCEGVYERIVNAGLSTMANGSPYVIKPYDNNGKLKDSDQINKEQKNNAIRGAVGATLAASPAAGKALMSFAGTPAGELVGDIGTTLGLASGGICGMIDGMEKEKKERQKNKEEMNREKISTQTASPSSSNHQKLHESTRPDGTIDNESDEFRLLVYTVEVLFGRVQDSLKDDCIDNYLISLDDYNSRSQHMDRVFSPIIVDTKGILSSEGGVYEDAVNALKRFFSIYGVKRDCEFGGVRGNFIQKLMVELKNAYLEGKDVIKVMIPIENESFMLVAGVHMPKYGQYSKSYMDLYYGPYDDSLHLGGIKDRKARKHRSEQFRKNLIEPNLPQ